MRYIAFFLTVFMLSISNLQAQNDGCLKDFNYLIEKVKVDYPGYNDKVKPENRDKLEILEKGLRAKINLYPDSCSFYLRQYVAYFKDNHLRVGKISLEHKRPEKSDISSYGKNIVIGDYKHTSVNSKNIEGIWTSWRGEIAIVKSKESESFLGVVINYHGWSANQVIFEFTPKNDTLFELKQHSNYKDSKMRNGVASLHLDKHILEIHDDSYFTRKTDSPTYDKAVLGAYTPEFPNGQNTFFVALCLSDSTFYIRIPSFMGFKNQIEQTISKNWENIMSRPNMIIDIRNNSGGQDGEYQALLKLIYTNPYTTKGVEWYATSGNIKLFEDALNKGEIRDGEEGIRWTKALITEMKKHLGGFVVHPFNTRIKDVPISKDSIYEYPKRVGIIINEGNASSAEQFLLSAKNSKKVTLFGNQPTAGVLDYSNAVTVDFPSGKYQLTFPMTRSQRLPENPIDNIGIKPEIIIPFPATVQLYDKLDTWVYFVKNYLEWADEK
ncbi:MAG TPA: S41 family peptidase [Bacteroidales bacterium]|nr:S41 family peptidase [Bacteroidales bacterium]